MSFEAVLPVWRAVRDRFRKTMEGLQEEELTLRLSPDTSTIGFMLRHNAEVEYMFADWFFKKEAPASVTYLTAGRAKDEGQFHQLADLLRLLEASDLHVTEAMRSLPEEAWDQPVETMIGTSTPREALGRLLYHAGLHAGQISLIRKCAPAERAVQES
ncbi:hypothetical protein BVG16_18580 [Paenibacillus selenitireducens]|jgi:hypothetical protein|uniref:DinB-like domain-containing protein n=1 Tax=Paenibacillus selenitireducens TaxID=1324314 RepID=A0A1T2X9E7_9BACL|nr:DinB family protein [Paenibacillus selenitireducens]OPA76213.1 hypothetical protein BVG16_18580 [Paenibacillus selenitireducens]